MNELCEERHRAIGKEIDVINKLLSQYGGKIDKLEQNDTANAVRIKNLCDQLGSLVTTMRWFIGLLVGGFTGFFFYVVQRGLIK